VVAAGRGARGRPWPLAVNPVIYAELCLGFESEADLASVLSDAGVRRLPLPYDAAWPASQAFARIASAAVSAPHRFPISFIGAHALVEKLPLLTRDAKRYRTYFPRVRLIAPS